MNDSNMDSKTITLDLRNGSVVPVSKMELPANGDDATVEFPTAVTNETSPLTRLAGKLTGRTVDISRLLSNLSTSQVDIEDENAVQTDAALESLVDFEVNFDVRHVLAAGGQGYISVATDKKLQRTVAVKSIHDTLKSQRKIRNAFISEAKITGQLEHPGIVPVHGLYMDKNRDWHLAMKLINGSTLRRYLEKTAAAYEKLSRRQRRWNEQRQIPQRLDIFLRICEAVSYAHHKKIIHRDLKPENIMLGAFNETYVTDWGLAESQVQTRSSRKSKKFSGTLQYIAPEIVRSRPYDSRSDIFALGLILFEIVFLKPAYRGVTQEEALKIAINCTTAPYKHRFKFPIDRDLKAVIRKCLAPNPAERYQNVQALMKDVRSYLRFDEVAAKPDHLWGKFSRTLRRHYRLFLALVLLNITALLGCFAYFAFEQLEQQSLGRIQESALAEIYSRGFQTANRLDYKLSSVDTMLSGIAREASFLLEREPFAGSNKVFYASSEKFRPSEVVPGLKFSPELRRQISREAVAYVPPPGMEESRTEALLSRLSPLKRTLTNMVTQSTWQDSIVGSDEKILKEIADGDQIALISWIYAGFSSGLYLCFPFRDDFDDEYRPQTRPWYLRALNSPDFRSAWSDPYADYGSAGDITVTCSRTIVNSANEVQGVVGADLSLASLRKIFMTKGSQNQAVKEKFLIDRDGRILVSSNPQHQPEIKEGEAEFHHFPDSALLAVMWNRRSGRIPTAADGCLYFFHHLDSVNWLYVERIDFNEMLRITRENQQSVR